MMLPIRCYTCGKVLANLTIPWTKHHQSGSDDWQPFFEKYNIKRYCCKRVLMAQVSDPNHGKDHKLPPSIVLSNDKIGNMFLAR